MTLTSVTNTTRLLWHMTFIFNFPRNKSLLWQCKTELKTPQLITGIFGYTWWYVDKIKFETGGWGDGGGGGGGGIKVSSLVHEEQHLRWLAQGPRVCQKTWSERRCRAACRGEAWRWVLRLVVELIPGFRPRQAPGQRLLRVDGRGVEGSCLPAAGISSGNW